MSGMNLLVKRTYSLPGETVDWLEQEVGSGERSRVVAEAVQFWLEARRRERLRRDVIAGCREMAELYQATSEEFAPLEDEAERHLA